MEIEKTLNGNYSLNGTNEAVSYEGMLNKIYTAIKEGQIIAIDGKALVGATSGLMNESLGQSLAFRRRGVTA